MNARACVGALEGVYMCEKTRFIMGNLLLCKAALVPQIFNIVSHYNHKHL